MPLSIRAIVLIYIVLFTLAIPWYMPRDFRLLFGLPLWVTVPLFISLLISVFTAWLLMRFKWPDE